MLIKKFSDKYAKGNKLNSIYIEKIVRDFFKKDKLTEADLK